MMGAAPQAQVQQVQVARWARAARALEAKFDAAASEQWSGRRILERKALGHLGPRLNSNHPHSGGCCLGGRGCCCCFCGLRRSWAS